MVEHSESIDLHAYHKQILEAKVIKGVCENCATAFDHTDSASAACSLVRGPEASFGQLDILGLEDAGWRVLLF